MIELQGLWIDEHYDKVWISHLESVKKRIGFMEYESGTSIFDISPIGLGEEDGSCVGWLG